MKYADAGTALHSTLEFFYDGVVNGNPPSLAECQIKFSDEWKNIPLDKEKYWECVKVGIARKLKPTHTEYEFKFSEPFNYLGYADLMDTKNHHIVDWKTSSFSQDKLDGYQQQLLIYAWAYRKQFGVVPKCTVIFNKVNEAFTFTFTDAQVDAKEKECIEIVKDIEQRWAEMRFERNPSSSNCFFCPYKTVCGTDLLRGTKKFVFHIVGDLVHIDGEFTEDLHKAIETQTNYLIKNAHFIIRIMRSKGIRDYDGIKRSYWRTEKGAKVSIGYMNLVYREILKRYKDAKVVIDDRRDRGVMDGIATIFPDKLNVPFEFAQHQKEGIDAALKYKVGTIVVGTGGGKTAMAAEIIRRAKCLRSLFIIDNKDLLVQTKREYEKMLGIKVGVVGMGKREFYEPVIVATIQTLAQNVKEFEAWFKTIGLVVFDEAHIISSTSFEKVSKKLVNTKYRIGMTATAGRDDGNEKLIFGRTGEVVYRMGAKELIQKGLLVVPKAIFYKAPEPDETLSSTYHDEYTIYISQNRERNELVKKIALEYAEQGKSVMILAKDIKNGQIPWLVANIPGSKLIYGATEDDLRVDILDEFKQKKLLILIGNSKIFNKGINIPTLDVIINAGGGAGEVAVVQTIGRVLRKYEGKTIGLYIDFIDTGIFLNKHNKKRIKALTDQGFEVVFA
jgi:superfamily II DNA or RNA helicase/CRISPR/Cas system-associated exonuclease Cas4 (RecB family)